MYENFLNKIDFIYSCVQIFYSIDLEFEILHGFARDFYLLL